MGAARGQHNKKSRSGSVNKMPNSSTCHNFSLARCRRLPPPPPLSPCHDFVSVSAFDLAASSRASSCSLFPIPYSLFLLRLCTHTHTDTQTDVYGAIAVHIYPDIPAKTCNTNKRDEKSESRKLLFATSAAGAGGGGGWIAASRPCNGHLRDTNFRPLPVPPASRIS